MKTTNNKRKSIKLLPISRFTGNYYTSFFSLLLLPIFTVISSITLFSNTNLVYAKSNTKQYKVGKEGTKDIKTDSTNQYKPNNTNINNNKPTKVSYNVAYPLGFTASKLKGNTKQYKVGKKGTKLTNNTNATNNKPTKVNYNVAYPLGFTTSKLQGNMYVDLAIGAGFALGNAINTLTGITQFVGQFNGSSTANRSGSAQDSSSVPSHDLIGVNFNAGIGYELIVQTRSKVNFYTALGFSYNMIGGHGTSVNHSVNARVADAVYYDNGTDKQQITYNSESTVNINQADLLHMVGAKVKLGISMLQDRLKVYGIVSLGALLPMHVTGNISVNNNVSEGGMLRTISNPPSGNARANGSLQPEESLQQDHTDRLNPTTTTNTAFLPGGGVGISYDIVPRRLAVFFEFEGMPVINTAGAAVLNSNTFTNTGNFVDSSTPSQTLLNVTNTVTSDTTTTSNGLAALFMIRTGIKLGF